jgi:hypothetical protein
MLAQHQVTDTAGQSKPVRFWNAVSGVVIPSNLYMRCERESLRYQGSAGLKLQSSHNTICTDTIK